MANENEKNEIRKYLEEHKLDSANTNYRNLRAKGYKIRRQTLLQMDAQVKGRKYKYKPKPAKEFTSWVKKKNIETDVKLKQGYYQQDYMAYFGSTQTIKDCSGGNCFQLIRYRYTKKGIMNNYDFRKIRERCMMLSTEAPVTLYIYSKAKSILLYKSQYVNGSEILYQNYKPQLFH